MTRFRIDYYQHNRIIECGFLNNVTKEQAEFLAGNYAAQEKYTGFKVNKLPAVRRVTRTSNDRELAIAAEK